jgi:flagellar hook protein FlgE
LRFFEDFFAGTVAILDYVAGKFFHSSSATIFLLALRVSVVPSNESLKPGLRRETSMRIESALFASREGLQSHGIAINVVGDNVSNANTVGYKNSRVEFADLFAEGGEGHRTQSLDPIGNGATVARIRQEHTAGIIDNTGRPLDAAIDGNGFFVVGDPTQPEYTRAGNFGTNTAGVLVDASGRPVLGFSATPPGEGEVQTLGEINIQNVESTGTPTTAAAMFGNLAASDDITIGVPTNPASFREIGQAANYTSNLTVYDSLGLAHELTIAFYKTGVSQWTVQAYTDSSEVGTAGATPGVPVQVGANVNMTYGPDGLIPEGTDASRCELVEWLCCR